MNEMNEMNEMDRKEALALWHGVLTSLAEMEGKALQVLRHPQSSDEELRRVADMVCEANRQLREVRQALQNKYGGRWA